VSARSAHQPKNYFPALDGLRAIAALAVVFYHLNLPGFRWGWSGVQLFFVLSGFLITGILLDTKDKPHYFKNFYIRRSLRIFPIYYLLIFALCIYGLARGFYIKPDLLPYYLTYTQNYIIGQLNFLTDYWGAINHTWSLAIEEQFYLIWPLLIFVLPRRAVPYVCIALVLLAIGWRAMTHLPWRHVTATPFSIALPAHIDALAGGGLIAYLSRVISPQRLILPAMIAMLIAVVAAWLTNFQIYDSFYAALGVDALGNPFANTLLTLFFGGAITLAAYGPTWLIQLFSLSPLRLLGKISYGIYLYHLPIISLGENAIHQLMLQLAPLYADALTKLSLLTLTLLIAAASWNIIERPLNALKDRLTPSRAAAHQAVTA
jgi:peptidoglycan/LPS O-acetylase OafA/YrhL